MYTVSIINLDLSNHGEIEQMTFPYSHVDSRMFKIIVGELFFYASCRKSYKKVCAVIRDNSGRIVGELVSNVRELLSEHELEVTILYKKGALMAPYYFYRTMRRRIY